jgi:hypothetical protein
MEPVLQDLPRQPVAANHHPSDTRSILNILQRITVDEDKVGS